MILWLLRTAFVDWTAMNMKQLIPAFRNEKGFGIKRSL